MKARRTSYATGEMPSAQGAACVAKRSGNLPRRIERWFRGNARDLPWRRRRTAYGTVVSEFMLQQTQVVRVCDAWQRFMRRFPTVASLARAREQDVLAACAGLGYYRRARHLQAAAKDMVRLHQGTVPRARHELEALPGIGPYCAGAVASIAFGAREAIVDGNVARVIMRVHGRAVDLSTSVGKRWVWQRAQEYVDAATNPGKANEGLMELGATVCTPRVPRCEMCPLKVSCEARRMQAQHRIPRAKPTPTRARVHRAAIIAVADGWIAQRVLPQRGLWARLPFPPLEESARPLSAKALAGRIGVKARAVERCGSFVFQTSHRDVNFVVWRVDSPTAGMLRREGRDGWFWRRVRAVKKAPSTGAVRQILQCGGTLPLLS